MSALREWLRRLKEAFYKTPEDAETEGALRGHLDMVEDEPKRRGLLSEDAARGARLKAAGTRR